ncbi:MAG: hypothetical protein CVV41_03105 [Candidatus Riflebacteria bacterium HGW-Riflebacteria-1]|jgi:hypothetical protein|nr:MAG: hypothetical protein CVV41_03105 [Candidatus Riflebacteria bacterium HGW-Riflebacteria-1]
MRHSARKHLLLLAVFLLFIGSGFTAGSNDQSKGRKATRQRPDSSYSADTNYFNPLAIPELRPPPEQPALVIDTGVTTAADPRFGSFNSSHRELFIPASELRPPAPAMSIPVLDRREPNRYDLNEWEEGRIFSSNLYTDSSFYATRVNGDKHLSSRDQGEFYETNYRYELFSTKQNGDSLALNLDTTYTNDRRPYRHGFTVNQATIDSRTRRSRLVLGHAFPEMSEFSMTQSVLGFYGMQKFDYTNVSGFSGYYANEREDLDNPRYIAGFRLEHSRDNSLKLGFNVVGTEDGRDNAASSDELPSMTNRVYSLDINMRPTENIFVDAEIAQSDTNYDKRDGPGEQKGDAYRFKTGYERENYNIEAGFEQGDTAFISPLGMTPRDERAYYARLYYELNRYISTRLSQRIARDNLANYQRSTIYREQPEMQVTVRPSEYYKNMRVDFHYQPLHEYSDQKGFMDRYRDLLWLEFNHRAGQFAYYAGLSQTIDKDDVNVLNDRDILRYDFTLTWEYDRLKKVYSSYSHEKLNYKRAGGMDETTWIGFGGSSRFHENILVSLDYMRENVDPITTSSNHDRINLSLTREYSATARLIIDLEGNRSSYSNNNGEFDDYTARLRYLKAY